MTTTPCSYQKNKKYIWAEDDNFPLLSAVITGLVGACCLGILDVGSSFLVPSRKQSSHLGNHLNYTPVPTVTLHRKMHSCKPHVQPFSELQVRLLLKASQT